MTAKEVVERFGIEHYRGEDKSHYIVYPMHISKDDAIRGANSYFKVNANKLKANKAYMIGDTIYFSRKDFANARAVKCDMVWAVEVIK